MPHDQVFFGGSVKGLNPAMQRKYWTEIIHREAYSTPNARIESGVKLAQSTGVHHDFWCVLARQYDGAAGAPSPLVQTSRRVWRPHSRDLTSSSFSGSGRRPNSAGRSSGLRFADTASSRQRPASSGPRRILRPAGVFTA
eukprot:TRINITY_DN93323_c0_g1_i1.p1 TRINITY_DN93323_c0_g1~~TRINITY_DN93323_c0_g1_i1.p1  ORF type:complete len:155 (-),score=19.30 TRINITY_DN93323_c0_g1_i1:141-560(-)